MITGDIRLRVTNYQMGIIPELTGWKLFPNLPDQQTETKTYAKLNELYDQTCFFQDMKIVVLNLSSLIHFELVY